jgi:HTH-type transcriptional regulator/antitoxin HigA
MTKADLVKYIGSQSRVSEILNRKRSLTLKMLKSLYRGLKIPADILLA